MKESEFIKNYKPSDFDRPSVTVDTVVFGLSRTESGNYRKLDEQRLSVLLVKRDNHPFQGKWALPGGFVAMTETLEDTACRVLQTKAGLQGIYLEQLYTYGAVDRDPRMRILSSAYVALVDRGQYKPTQAQAAWFEVSFDEEKLLLSGVEEIKISLKQEIKRNGKLKLLSYTADDNHLAFDHAQIVADSLLRIRNKVEYTDIAFNLVPDEFTISELQQVYEIILGTELIPAAFRRKIADSIEETGNVQQDKGHRPSKLYRYKAAL